jgi:hypothetical protein
MAAERSPDATGSIVSADAVGSGAELLRSRIHEA